jgi:hypothetical protein
MSNPQIIGAILGILLYVPPVYLLARKFHHTYAFLAFVPFGNLWLMCDLAQIKLVIALLLLIPVYGILLFYALCWMKLATRLKMPFWTGLLMLLPLINYVTLYFLAYHKVEWVVETGIPEEATKHPG